MPKRCKEKGPSFERTSSRLLKRYWGRGSFMRTKNLQILSREGRHILGDVACILDTNPPSLDPLFPFSVECKKQESWDFADLLKGNISSTILGFWEQCVSDAKRWDRIPLLIFSRNYYGVYVAWPTGIQIDTVPICCDGAFCHNRFLVRTLNSSFFITTWERFTKMFPIDWKLVDSKDLDRPNSLRERRGEEV